MAKVLIARVSRGSWETCAVGDWLVSCYADDFPENHPGVTGIRTVDQEPTPCARNNAVGQAQADGVDIVVMCDNDMQAQLEFLPAGRSVSDGPEVCGSIRDRLALLRGRPPSSGSGYPHRGQALHSPGGLDPRGYRAGRRYGDRSHRVQHGVLRCRAGTVVRVRVRRPPEANGEGHRRHRVLQQAEQARRQGVLLIGKVSRCTRRWSWSASPEWSNPYNYCPVNTARRNRGGGGPCCRERGLPNFPYHPYGGIPYHERYDGSPSRRHRSTRH